MAPRRAVLSDAQAIAEVQIATSRAAYRSIIGQSQLATLDVRERTNVWSDLIANERDCVLVVDAARGILGYAHARCSAIDDGHGEIASVYVVPRHWRNGIGSALLGAAESWLTSRGFKHARLWLLEDNGRARAFYEARGYALDAEAKRATASAPQICYCKFLQHDDA